MIVPDQRPAVSRALIRSLAARDIREQQKRCTANKKQSLPHVLTGLANMPDNSLPATRYRCGSHPILHPSTLNV
jgi:hypothetical protein